MGLYGRSDGLVTALLMLTAVNSISDRRRDCGRDICDCRGSAGRPGAICGCGFHDRSGPGCWQPCDCGSRRGPGNWSPGGHGGCGCGF